MSDSASHSLPLPDKDSSPKGTSPNGREAVRWEIVARMPGIAAATIVAGRLQVENIPVRIWQEGAGQALGLTVGILGTGYVAVPEDFVEEALDILEGDEEDTETAEYDDDES